jgi:hypothetical protein
MQELDPCRKRTLLKPEGTQSVGKPKVGWFESVEEDLKNMGVWNWRSKQQEREEWRTVLKRLRSSRTVMPEDEEVCLHFFVLVWNMVCS